MEALRCAEAAGVAGLLGGQLLQRGPQSAAPEGLELCRCRGPRPRRPFTAPLHSTNFKMKFVDLRQPVNTLQKGTVLRVSASTKTKDAVGNLVVVTREHGKNGKLMKALEPHGIRCLELPLIEHRPGPDLERLPQVLRDEDFEWIIVTSPEAANVFLEGWRAAGNPAVRLAVVGAGTGVVFEEAPEAESLRPAFTPSKATAKFLSAELPKLEGPGSGRVLYPASAKAGSDLEEGLRARGFQVIRLNTYSTESARNLHPAAVDAAAEAPVATFGSPTAVKAWVEVVCKGNPQGWQGAAACIGSTSAVAAQRAGLTRVYHPESPGIEGWVKSVLEALESEVLTAR